MRTSPFEKVEKNHHGFDQKHRFVSGEYHVCGVIVSAQLKHLQSVTQTILTMDGAEIYLTNADGRIVVTLEDTENISSYQQMLELQTLKGVLSVDLMSHFFDLAS